MLIECTFCHATAKIPDSKEGAKVQCGKCGKVYVAREPGSKGGTTKTNPTPFIIGGAGVIGIGLIAFFATRGGPKTKAPPPAPPPKVEAPKIDREGWNSEFVQAVKGIYDAAKEGNSNKLAGCIMLQRRVEHLRSLPDGDKLPAFAEMTPLQKDDLQKTIVESWLHGEGDIAIAKWKPTDGKVLAEGDTEFEVRMEVAGREAPYDIENRFYDWKLARDKDGKWKAWSWERYISPEEKRAHASSLSKEISKVQVDGGTLYQADPRPLPHLDDTPPEMRTKIDGLVEKLLDLSMPAKQVTKVRTELHEIGKPALPILLTKMYEIKIVDEDSLMRVTQVHAMLKDITGYDPGFSPLGSGPESERKREITIKAWFAWYLRKGERFEERKEGTDALEGLVKPTEKDKREIEKAKAQADKLKKGGG